MKDPVPLSRFEKLALALGRFTNERALPKRFSQWWLTRPTLEWVKYTIGPRFHVDADGVDKLMESHPDRGVILVSNHRSFFDMYAIMLANFWRGTGWVERIFFPVRSNFFYEQPLGVLINMAIGGGSMYPPVFRDPAKAPLNQVAVDTVTQFLHEPGVIVGMHPEGTRNKGDDAYDMLPAQPGVGQMILSAKPIVVPVFINGLSNDFVGECVASVKGQRRERPIVMVIGDPLDYSAFTQSKPRAALYKKTADLCTDAIKALMPREKELRAKILSGEIGDDGSWLFNLPRYPRR
jgi:1-acyl-sn-glycerol-3-phosphate acyltransferase